MQPGKHLEVIGRETKWISKGTMHPTKDGGEWPLIQSPLEKANTIIWFPNKEALIGVYLLYDELKD